MTHRDHIQIEQMNKLSHHHPSPMGQLSGGNHPNSSKLGLWCMNLSRQLLCKPTSFFRCSPSSPHAKSLSRQGNRSWYCSQQSLDHGAAEYPASLAHPQPSQPLRRGAGVATTRARHCGLVQARLPEQTACLSYFMLKEIPSKEVCSYRFTTALFQGPGLGYQGAA